MKAFLLDTNVLIALLWPSHIHHQAAVKWFTRNRSQGWATCPITQAGFVRVVSNPAFSRDAPSTTEAITVLAVNLEAGDHQFWPDATGFAETVSSFTIRIVGHQQVTDAYLLGLAIRRKGVLATFDASIAVLLDPQSPDKKSLAVLRA